MVAPIQLLKQVNSKLKISMWLARQLITIAYHNWILRVIAMASHCILKGVRRISLAFTWIWAYFTETYSLITGFVHAHLIRRNHHRLSWHTVVFCRDVSFIHSIVVRTRRCFPQWLVFHPFYSFKGNTDNKSKRTSLTRSPRFSTVPIIMRRLRACTFL